MDSEEQTAFSARTYHPSDPFQPVTFLSRVRDDVSTGDDFQHKMEDDLYEKKEEDTDRYSDWLGKICLTALAATFVFACVIGCIALVKVVL